jgi:hypothetical protein
MLGRRTTLAWGGLGVRKNFDRFQNSRRWFHMSSLDRRLRFLRKGLG